LIVCLVVGGWFFDDLWLVSGLMVVGGWMLRW